MSQDIIPSQLIIKKRNGNVLSEDEIQAFIKGVTDGTFSESQIASMLMAMYFNELNQEETLYLTKAMIKSGEVMEWPEEWKHLVVDKHSTGGVGDKCSLPLVPALACCGLKVPMISGRGLGLTGGTLDKLESIPGFQVMHSTEKIRQIVQDVGGCIVGQTQNLVPADKKMYAIRDVTGTIDIIPMIIGSIISKKAAEGISALILEITYGGVAPMPNLGKAQELATKMTKVGNELGMKTAAIFVPMDRPMGCMIGNALECIEAVKCLQGKGPPDLEGYICEMGGQLLHVSGLAATQKDGKDAIRKVLHDGTGLKRFSDMLQAQGVEKCVAEDICNPECDIYKHLPKAQHHTVLGANTSGVVKTIDARSIGTLVHHLGGGRKTPTDSLQYAVGIELLTQVGQEIKEGDPWCKVHHDTECLQESHLQLLRDAFVVTHDAKNQ